MFRRLLASALVFGMAATAPPATAQQAVCAPRDSITERLSGLFSENQTGLGLQSGNSLVEVWTSDLTGTWTILVTRPDGISCPIASGSNWLGAPVPHLADLGTPS